MATEPPSAAEAFYRATDPLVSQGDIVRLVPHLHLKGLPLVVLRQQSTRTGMMFARHPYQIGAGAGSVELHPPPGGFKITRGEGELVSAFCQVALGIVINYDCSIENDSKHRLVALIRPLGGLPPPDQAIIRRLGAYRFYYLAALAGILEESYVDLRRITCVAPGFVDDQERITSLTPSAVKGLVTQLFLYLTRQEIA